MHLWSTRQRPCCGQNVMMIKKNLGGASISADTFMYFWFLQTPSCWLKQKLIMNSNMSRSVNRAWSSCILVSHQSYAIVQTKDVNVPAGDFWRCTSLSYWLKVIWASTEVTEIKGWILLVILVGFVAHRTSVVSGDHCFVKEGRSDSVTRLAWQDQKVSPSLFQGYTFC